jgi:uncharacterized lipoprotein YmbA
VEAVRGHRRRVRRRSGDAMTTRVAFNLDDRPNGGRYASMIAVRAAIWSNSSRRIQEVPVPSL